MKLILNLKVDYVELQSVKIFQKSINVHFLIEDFVLPIEDVVTDW